MTRDEFIAKLQELPDNGEVVMISNNFELNGSLVPIEYIGLYPNGLMEERPFRDAFDGTQFTKEVYRMVGGDKPIIVLS